MQLVMKHYRHLSKRDRVKIGKMKSHSFSLSQIAKVIGVDKSTISREIRRNGQKIVRDITYKKKLFLELGLLDRYAEIKNQSNIEKTIRYESKYAEKKAKFKAKKSVKRTKIPTATRLWVFKQLRAGWTPDQVAGRSKQECTKSISHESVYRMIIADKKKGGKIYRSLTRFGKRKNRISERNYNRELIPKRVGIEQRPAVVNARRRLGDLEGDLIVGSKSESYLLTVVDRVSRQIAIELLAKRDRNSVRDAFLRAMKRMPKPKTLTLDNAREFSCHVDLTKQMGVKVYFSNPYASFERGSIENANGVIRRTYPKGTDFRNVTQKQIASLEKRLNSTPKKVLGYQTANELTYKLNM